MSDETVMRYVQKRYPRAREELVHRFSDRMLRMASRILRSSEMAEDAVQDAWLNILTHAGKFQFRSRVSTWIFRVTYNAVLQCRRKEWVRPRQYFVPIERLPIDSEFLIDLHQEDPANIAITRGLAWRFQVFIAELNPTHAQAMKAYLLSHQRADSAAASLGISVPALTGRVRLARQHLRERFRMALRA